MTVPYIFATQGSASGVPIGAFELDENFSYLDTEIADLAASGVKVANIVAYGAVCDFNGSTGTDNTTAFRKAIATGLPVYVPGVLTGLQYLVSDILTLANTQVMYGDGVVSSVIAVSSGFNLSALGVVRLGSSETGGALTNIGFSAVQPDTSSFGSLTQYPPAIYAQGVPGARVFNTRISRFITGIDARGNSGHMLMQNIEGSCFGRLIWIDGAQDEIVIEGMNAYPFGLSANQQIVFASSYGISSGRCDSGFWSKLQGVGCAATVNLYAGAGGFITRTTIDSVYGDTSSTLRMSAGDVTIGELYSGSAKAADYAIFQTGGNLTIGAVNAFTNAVNTNPLIRVQSTAASSASSISTTTLAVGGTITGIVELGQVVGGAGVSGGTIITGNAITNPGAYTGTGAAGTYGVNNSQTVGSEAMTFTAIEVSGAVTQVAPVSLQIGALNGKLNSHDVTLVYSDGLGNQSVNIGTMSVQRDSGVAYSNPTMNINTGGGSLGGFCTTGVGGGSGVAMSIGSSAYFPYSNVTLNGWTISQTQTVATLPAVANVPIGTRSWVTDATATTFHSIVAGSGSNKVPVVSDGANWLIG